MSFKLGTAAVLLFIGAALFLLRLPSREFEIKRPVAAPADQSLRAEGTVLPVVPEAPQSTTTVDAKIKGAVSISTDAPKQKPLIDPPDAVKGIYATSWSAGLPARVAYFIDFIKRNKLNAIVIDIKDYSGYVGYMTDIPLVTQYRAQERRISNVNALIKRFHDEGIYVIGRIAVFQDQRVIAARPELAVKTKSTGEIWRDRMKLGWVDPSSHDVWEYNIAIAKDALARGFDEINFDYIRFPSDGDLENLSYPVWDGKTSRAEVIQGFARYVDGELGGAITSADVFGLTVVKHDDMGIGQYFENIAPNFDYVAPMVYPSHYAKGFLGYANPAKYPYEVVKYSIDEAMKRIRAMSSATSSPASSTISEGKKTAIAKVRPWLQVFDMGDTYDASKVREQIRAAAEGGAVGYLLWSPSNVYVDYAQ